MKLIRSSVILLIFIVFVFGCSSKRQLMFEWPKVDKNYELVKHKYYALQYCENHEIALWTAYSLDSKETYPYVRRSYNYKKDTLVHSGTASYNDYKHSGFDRGHLIPARDMEFNHQAQNEVNFMSNISPQERGFNRGIWKVLESKVRKWADMYDSILVVTGPILNDSLPKIGKETKISVPEAFYKVVLIYNDTLKSGIGFIIPNQDGLEPDISNYVVSIDSLEEIVNLDFFPKIPRKYEFVEDSVEKKYWNL